MSFRGQKQVWAPELSSLILAGTSHRDQYVEPFLGSGAMAAAMAPHFNTVHLSDSHVDLINMWDALLFKDWTPPTQHISYDEYKAYKTAPPSPDRTFIGFWASQNGVWFQSYAVATKQHYLKRYSDLLISHRDNILKCPNVVLTCASYINVTPPPDSVNYNDPPYAGTDGYRDTIFDPINFWRTAYSWATQSKAHVFISEHQAIHPAFKEIWSKAKRSTAPGRSKKSVVSYERLFTLASPA